eukprot:EG_transcript_53562
MISNGGGFHVDFRRQGRESNSQGRVHNEGAKTRMRAPGLPEELHVPVAVADHPQTALSFVAFRRRDHRGVERPAGLPRHLVQRRPGGVGGEGAGAGKGLAELTV